MSRFWPGPRILAALPGVDAWPFPALCKRFGFDALPQQGNDLGQRMLQAMGVGVAEYGRCAVLGCDVPHIPGSILLEASRTIESGRTVIGPAVDGGFYLLGTGIDDAALFEGITWGAADVRECLLSNLTALGENWQLLPELRDIDTWEDLQWLAANDRVFSRFAPPGDDC